LGTVWQVAVPGLQTVTEVKIPLKYGADVAETVPGPLGPKPTVTGAVLLETLVVPVPVKPTFWVPSPSIMVSEPVAVPLAVGENVTLMLQEPFAATLEPQVLL
jgi:hypothetical protein